MTATLSEPSGRRSFSARDPLLVRLAARPEIAAAILLGAMSVTLLVATPTFASQENLIWICYSFSVIAIATGGVARVVEI